ncbi:MAG TPA: hypothetical protein VGQ30_11555 [Gemmatimonadaceae bacterium]|jgi:hypothetical protein|nr:hypothetical protein [Gemmatimonadaceae bacterium]
MRALITGILLAMTAQAADVGGRWAGTIDAGGGAHPLYARFKQDAKGVSGTFGSDTTKLPPISNVRTAGDSITFDVTWGDVMHIVLVKRGGELRGELHADGPPPPPGKHASVIAIALKRG